MTEKWNKLNTNRWVFCCTYDFIRNKGRKGRACVCYNTGYILSKQDLNIHSSRQWLLILLQNTLELHSELYSEVTFNHIAHYSRHILSFTYSIPPSLPVSILLLTFGWQPERSPLSLHISAQQHSHGLCFARTHRSSPLNLLLPSESWLMPGPSSPSCWININIHHLALRLSQPHNDQLLNNTSFMWVIGRNELAVVHLFVGHIYLQYGGLKLFFSQPLLLYII